MTLEQIHRAVKEGWHPPDGTPLMDFIWNAALDAAAEECRPMPKCSPVFKDACERCMNAILALKKGGTQ